MSTKTWKYYWEDFPVGKVREFGSYVVSAEEIMDLAASTTRNPSTSPKKLARPACSAGCAPAAGTPVP